MKCSNCNQEIEQDLAVCPKCGHDTDDNETVKKVSLKCEHCGGTLAVDNDKPILLCPYCGNQSLIIENDAVAIERIKTAAKKEIEIEKIKSIERMQKAEYENKQKTEEKESINKFKKSPWAIILIIAFLISGVFSFLYFVSGFILAGILSVVQMVCFACAWCMGMNIIKGKKRYLHILVAIVGIILILPTFMASNVAAMNADAYEIEWDTILISDKIPEPESLKVEIHDNEDDELWIEIYNTSEEEYYEYTVECKEWGYLIEISETSSNFAAYNDEGYKINLSYSDYNKIMSIRLVAPTEVYELEWDKHAVASILPNPSSTLGVFKEENESTNKIIVSNTSEDDYMAYCDACKETGFDIDSESGTTSYKAYDENGNKITISYNSGNKEMTIDFYYPMEFKEITWPIVGVGTLAPVPKSLYGNVSSDYDWAYSVYLDNVTREEYEEYIQECIRYGFDKDISNYENSFWADYSDEISINISYEGLNIMYIRVAGSASEDYSSLTREVNDEAKTEVEEIVSEPEEISEIEEIEEVEDNQELNEIQEQSSLNNEISSEYERAYVRDLSEYLLYIMFDEDSKKVVCFGTNDTYVMRGSYNGSFSDGIIISWDDGWNESFSHVTGNTATLTDGNGFDWDYKVCDVNEAQNVLDDFH